jgi:membrane-bound ClpP family serine protease
VGLLGSVYRVVVREVTNPTSWDWIWSGFCLIVGLGGFTTFEISWPLILILAGVVLLAGLFWRPG